VPAIPKNVTILHPSESIVPGGRLSVPNPVSEGDKVGETGEPEAFWRQPILCQLGNVHRGDGVVWTSSMARIDPLKLV